MKLVMDAVAAKRHKTEAVPWDNTRVSGSDYCSQRQMKNILPHIFENYVEFRKQFLETPFYCVRQVTRHFAMTIIS